MSCGSKSEDRKQRERRPRFNGKLGVTHSTRERQRESNTQKTLFQNNALTQCTCVCVQCTLLYKSIGGLTEVLSYFNALKERLHKSPKIYSLRNIFLCVTDRSQPTRYSVLGLTDRSLPTRSSASSADGPRLLQPTRPMLSLYLNKDFPF